MANKHLKAAEGISAVSCIVGKYRRVVFGSAARSKIVRLDRVQLGALETALAGDFNACIF